jgi:hypothetical protein
MHAAPKCTVSLKPVDQLLQLLFACVRALGHPISRMVRKLHSFDEICVESECLQGKYCGADDDAS